MKKTLKDLDEKYDLQLEKIVSKIKKSKAKLVLLQFPDGLKLYATSVVDYLRENTRGSEFLIWMSSCFGACDTPVLPREIEKKIDLCIQFGHNSLQPTHQ